MTLEVFNPPVPPSLGADQATAFKIKTAEFGDGYIQRAADGINNATVTWNLMWNALSPANAQTIRDFFAGKAGWQAFLYTVTGDIQRKYISGPLKRTQAHGKSDSFSVTLTEVHDP